MRILVTGVAGFIGATLALKLLSQQHTVIGVDNLNDYYDVNLKKQRLARCQKNVAFYFHFINIADRAAMERLFIENTFDIVVHLAAQPGVRYSVENPHVYIEANLLGFTNVLEGCRHHKIGHFVYASSSSVYGANTKQPFGEADSADHPLSLYGATKRANELMAHSYAHLYDLPCTGLRFFTVYGPWGRPDMALIKFTNKIMAGEAIPVFNHGNLTRDFTYIDDIVEGINRIMHIKPKPRPNKVASPATSPIAPYQIYNIGNNQPVSLISYIRILEKKLGIKAILDMQPMQAGDVTTTFADVSELESQCGALPHTSIEDGISKFVQWYENYYQVDCNVKNTVLVG